MLLNLKTRPQFNTLLDALTLTNASSDPAIIYLATGQDPLTVTRAEFKQEAENYASALVQLGIQPSDLVVIAHTQNLESIYAFWGALLLGAVPSMFPTLTEKLDPQKYFESMALLVEHSESRSVLTTVEFAPQMREIVQCPVYDSAQIKQASTGEFEAYTPSAEIVAFLQHSSGTTGLQKGVALSHMAVLNQLASYASSLELQTDDVLVSWLPLYHDMGLIAGFLLPLVQGVPLVLMSPFDWVRHPAMLFQAITDYQGTFCWLPNFAYNHCVRRIRQGHLDGIDLSSMRAFINCSEPVHQSSHEAFFERFADYGVRREQLGVSYAMAENTFAVTQTSVGKVAAHEIINKRTLEDQKCAKVVEAEHPDVLTQVSCGKPIANVTVRALDDNNNPLPERQVGELAIQSDCMLSGYYKRPDLNEKIFTEGWYLTGDMGYVANDEVYVIGRKKDLIIAAGKNIYPQDLEAVINDAGIENLKPGRNVVFGVWDDKEGTELIAIVAECVSAEKEIRQGIVRQIRRVIVEQTTVTAQFVTIVDEQWLLKTSSGKIARAANHDKWLAEFMS